MAPWCNLEVIKFCFPLQSIAYPHDQTHHTVLVRMLRPPHVDALPKLNFHQIITYLCNRPTTPPPAVGWKFNSILFKLYNRFSYGAQHT